MIKFNLNDKPTVSDYFQINFNEKISNLELYSNWNTISDLREEQIQMAAIDVYIIIELFSKLIEKH